MTDVRKGHDSSNRSWRDRIRGISAMLNHDFCPGANRYVYWLKQPIGWFAFGALAALLTAIFVSPHAWVIFGAISIVTVIGVCWPWIGIRGASAELSFDRSRCHEGETVRVILSVRNKWPIPLWGITVEKGFSIRTCPAKARSSEGFSIRTCPEALSSLDSQELPVTALASVPGWSVSEFHFDFTPSQRGVYPLEQPELATAFPFGLWRASRPIPMARELITWPETTSLSGVPDLGSEIPDVVGMLMDQSGSEGDVIGVRPFRQGDRLRSIHWAQTARRDAFIVTERQSAARRLAEVICDEQAFVADHHVMETVIRVAASVTREFHSHQVRVRFVLGDIDMALEPGPAGMQRLLDALARYQVDAKPANSQIPSPATPDAMIVFVTSPERARLCPVTAKTQTVLIGDVHRGKGGRRTMQIGADPNYGKQLRKQWERACHVATG